VRPTGGKDPDPVRDLGLFMCDPLQTIGAPLKENGGA
jgi:hypothetical protein